MKKTIMLKTSYQFRRVLSKGCYYKGNFLDIYIKKNNKKINMIGIAISKKAGKSVKRNRIKRLIRECYKVLEMDINAGYDIVTLWKKKENFNDFNFYSIKEECRNLFIKANIL